MKVTKKSEIAKHLMEKHYGAMHYKGTTLGKNMEYVVSPGICNGDYGGPLYHKLMANAEYKHYVVTGFFFEDSLKIEGQLY